MYLETWEIERLGTVLKQLKEDGYIEFDKGDDFLYPYDQNDIEETVELLVESNYIVVEEFRNGFLQARLTLAGMDNMHNYTKYSQH